MNEGKIEHYIDLATQVILRNQTAVCCGEGCEAQVLAKDENLVSSLKRPKGALNSTLMIVDQAAIAGLVSTISHDANAAKPRIAGKRGLMVETTRSAVR
jgi:hypothetical protein